jgi:L-iditol 2-dehydrogenase
MTNRAVVIKLDPRRIETVDRPVDELIAGEVIVKSMQVGVCRSDIEMLDGNHDDPMPPYPVVVGHEWAGIVEEVGPGVTDFKKGDRVVGVPDMGNNEWFGHSRHGAAATLFTCPARLLRKIPDSFSWTRATMIEPYACAFNNITKIGGINKGDLVVIIGGGVIGICALSIAHYMGGTVVVVEPNKDRHHLAKEADYVISPAGGDVKEQIKKLTGKDGADVVIECAGVPASMASALVIAKRLGRIAMMGVATEEPVLAPVGLIRGKDLTVMGITGAAPECWDPCIAFLETHNIDMSWMVTKTFTFEEAAEAFLAARDGSTNLKVHLTAN